MSVNLSKGKNGQNKFPFEEFFNAKEDNFYRNNNHPPNHWTSSVGHALLLTL
jgi:hypothetical protein